MTDFTPTRHARNVHAAPLRVTHSTLLESLLLLCVLVFAATTCLAISFLSDQSQANKRRHAVEQTQFVCLDQSGRILTHETSAFKECVPVVFRRADEDGVN